MTTEESLGSKKFVGSLGFEESLGVETRNVPGFKFYCLKFYCLKFLRLVESLRFEESLGVEESPGFEGSLEFEHSWGRKSP